MDTTEKDQVKEPSDATPAEIQSRESGDDDEIETKANLGEEDRLEKEPSDTDARELKGGDSDKVEVMEGKKRHLLKDAKLFPMFFTMFGFRLIAGIHLF